jgi:hypothetical protein
MTARYSVGNGLADCSNITSERPHEFFDYTGAIHLSTVMGHNRSEHQCPDARSGPVAT